MCKVIVTLVSFLFFMCGCSVLTPITSSNSFLFNLTKRPVSSSFVYVLFSDPSLSKSKEYFLRNQYASASDETLDLASKGNTNAMFIRANMLLYFSENQSKEGIALLEKASSLGNGYASGLLAEFYFRGRFIKKDLSKSLHYSKLAAKADVAEGYTWLGVNYIYNNEIKEITTGLELLEKGEEMGAVDALYERATLYRDGIGYSQNTEKAISLFNKIAEMDMFSGSNALLEIGNIYESGIGTKVNSELAEAYYNKAIKKGNYYGYCRIGMMYIEGKAVQPSPEKTDEMYKKAESKGLDCQKFEDLMYEGIKI